jgi:polyisoprenoid-binding protein YceI
MTATPMTLNGMNTSRYLIDTRASQFTVQAFANGLIAVVAHSPKLAIRNWMGEVHLANDNLQALSIRARIKADSVEVLDELRESDRRTLYRVMNEEVLETARFPEVVFESSDTQSEKLREDLYRLKVRGKLTFHGVSNDHTFIAQTSVAADSARAYGEFKVRQSDYNVRIASIAGGHIKLQDELKFSFYIVARKES